MKLFNKQKFKSLTPYQQHKHLASLLRSAYEQNKCGKVPYYEEYLNYLDLLPPPLHSLEAVADRYHWHLQKGNISIKEPNFLPALPSKDHKTMKTSKLPVSIYLEKIRSAHNVGSILRTTEAMGFEKVFFSESMAFTDNKQVQDSSMHTFQWVECEKITSLDSLPKPLIALEIHPEGSSIHDYPFPNHPFTLALGNEEYGCSKELLARSDAVVHIPLRGRKSSLNVSNAFAIATYAITQHLGTHYYE